MENISSQHPLPSIKRSQITFLVFQQNSSLSIRLRTSPIFPRTRLHTSLKAKAAKYCLTCCCFLTGQNFPWLSTAVHDQDSCRAILVHWEVTIITRLKSQQVKASLFSSSNLTPLTCLFAFSKTFSFSFLIIKIINASLG